jgi:hypothetical protein
MTAKATRRGAVLGLGAAMLTGTAFAQEPARAGFGRLMNEGRYLPVWRETVGAHPPDFNVQWASFVGEEGVALAGRYPPLTDPLAADAEVQDAVAAIAEAARGRRVVLLNESHSASRHRLFLAKVMRALRPEGFDILACETFANRKPGEGPSVYGLRAGQPFEPSNGYYTYDPVFADTVREALERGYRLQAYEHNWDQRDMSLKGAEAIARREIAQAENLAAVLAANPSSRVLVHVGFSHLRKTPDHRGNQWMTMRLQEKTGIEPLSVSQAYTGSYGPHGADPALTQAVLARFAPKAPIVVRAGGRALGAEAAGADLAVFHPSLPDVEGRPGWLAADPGRRRLVVATPQRPAGDVVIVQAVHAYEPDRAVPADQHVLAKDERRAVLFLRPGTYRLRLESEAGFATLRTLTVPDPR